MGKGSNGGAGRAARAIVGSAIAIGASVGGASKAMTSDGALSMSAKNYGNYAKTSLSQSTRSGISSGRYNPTIGGK